MFLCVWSKRYDQLCLLRGANLTKEQFSKATQATQEYFVFMVFLLNNIMEKPVHTNKRAKPLEHGKHYVIKRSCIIYKD